MRDTAWLLGTLVLIAIAMRFLTLGDTPRQHDQCKRNLSYINTACEMYSTDNYGRYPKTMAELVPKYLKSIPTCPAAGRDTYSHSFVSASDPDMFTVMCEGDNHPRSGCGINHPSVDQVQFHCIGM